jgi:hypothetical protein
MYSQIKTFKELCELGCKFIKNEIKTHPFLIIDQNKDNLYELDEKTEWIRDYLYKYNKMGFYTVMSQPGSDYPIKIYPTYLDYKNSFNKNIKPLEGTFGVKQRAEVEGFMKVSDALKLCSILSTDKEIMIKISVLFDKDDLIAEPISLNKYTTLSYQIENSGLRFMETESELNELIRFEFEGIERDLKLSMMKHVVRRYFVVRNYPLKKHIPNLIDTDIIGISIMDLTWDRNDYLWEKIYFCLKNIK